MDKLNDTRLGIARDIFWAFLPHPEFKLGIIDERSFEITSARCIVSFGFERYEPTLSSVLFFDPSEPGDTGMAYWILHMLLSLDSRQLIVDKKAPYKSYGDEIVTQCAELLKGDFSCRKTYDAFENRILDNMSSVMALPAEHPAKVAYEANDLSWLDKL